MARAFRPILGFGPWGWVLLPIALSLAYCCFGGYDLRFALMGWYYDRYGWNGLNALIMEWMQPYNWSKTSIVAGPVTLVPVLLAMFLAPRRWAWWLWWIVVVWMLVNPALWWWVCCNMPKAVATYLGWIPLGSREVLGVTLAQFAVFVALVWMITGRRSALILLCAGIVVGVVEWTADWWGNSAPGRFVPYYVIGWRILGASWQTTVFAVLVGSAIAGRGRARAEAWRCGECGYDLRGLTGRSAAVCPECGRGTGS